jgi:hypothetical protein
MVKHAIVSTKLHIVPQVPNLVQLIAVCYEKFRRPECLTPITALASSAFVGTQTNIFEVAFTEITQITFRIIQTSKNQTDMLLLKY